MMKENEDIFYYITLYNENYPMPPMPDGVEEGILRGIYKFRPANKDLPRRVQLFGSGAPMRCVLEAQQLLEERFHVAADVWSVTSYQLLRNDALRCERWNMLHPEEEHHIPYIEQVLGNVSGPFVAVSDFMKAVPDQIARWVPRPWTVMGTDGFGRSDTREALRRFFEIDAPCIVIAALHALQHGGQAGIQEVAAAIQEMEVDPDKIDPLSI
jgi:pyruvate dehydrogenase E1 component